MIGKLFNVVAIMAFVAVCLVFYWRMVPAAGTRSSVAAPPLIPTVPLTLDSAATQGGRTAGVAIIVFSDFECPFCGQFANVVVPALEREYVSTGKVLLSFAELPLEALHPHSFQAAEAAECAGAQGQFWPMHDQMYSDQRHLDSPSLVDKARAAHLDVAQFKSCLTSHLTEAQVRRDLALARSLRISATPTLLVGDVASDGRVRVTGVVTAVQRMESLRPVLDRLLLARGRSARVTEPASDQRSAERVRR